MRNILITNNKLAEQAYKDVCNIVFVHSDMKGVLKTVRDYIHRGNLLLSHPLSGSVKPNENPYKSVMVSAKSGEVDLDSLRIIENAIVAADKFPPKYENMTETMHLDFQNIDCSLIKSFLII